MQNQTHQGMMGMAASSRLGAMSRPGESPTKGGGGKLLGQSGAAPGPGGVRESRNSFRGNADREKIGSVLGNLGI